MLIHAFAAVLAATAVTAPQDTAPTWSSTGASIAFDRTAPSGSGVDVIPSAGGRETFVARGDLAAWKPGGAELGILQRSRTRIVNRAGREVASLPGALAGWSPDGSRTAWVAQDGLYVGDADGGNPRRIVALTTSSTSTFDRTRAAWSPDGTRLAFTLAGMFRSSVAVVNADGSGLRPVFMGPNQNVNPSWSYDSRTIAFESNPGGRYWHIWLVGADGTDPHMLDDGAWNDRFPVWAPFTPHLAFISDRDHRYALYVDFVPSGRTRNEAEDVDPTSPAAWSPDARRLAYSARRECDRWGIYTKLFGARTDRRLTNVCHFDGTQGHQVLRGTPYRDFIRAGAGSDRIFGLAGNDVIRARNGFRDVVDCGPGRDIAIVDRVDVVRRCERVLR